MKYRRFIALFLILAPSLLLSQGSSSIAVLPGSQIYPAFTADALRHGISISRMTDNREWLGTIGGALPLVRLQTDNTTVQFGAAVTAFNRLIKTPGHITVYTIDYKVDFPIDVEMSAFTLRGAYGHMSCHFADDGIEILGRRSISSVRDYLTLGGTVAIPAIGGFAYLSTDYNYHNEPDRDKRWLVQSGAEAGGVALAPWASAYVALDIKVRQNVAWGTTQSYQVGVRFFPHDQRALRLAYTLRTGFEERGQLYTEKVIQHLIGLHIDV